MFGSIKEFFLKRLIVKGVIGQLEKMFAKLPQNDAKTINGVLIMCLGIVLSTLPQTSPFAQPILDYLHSLPADQIVAGGVLWSAVGLFHKVLKWSVAKAGFETAAEKKEIDKIEKTADVVTDKIIEKTDRVRYVV